jgi:hypothetical protein
MPEEQRRGNTIRIPAGKLTGRILAEAVGVSPDTVIRWRKANLLPYSTEQHGSLIVYLFGHDAIATALALKKGNGKLTDRIDPAA